MRRGQAVVFKSQCVARTQPGDRQAKTERHATDT